MAGRQSERVTAPPDRPGAGSENEAFRRCTDASGPDMRSAGRSAPAGRPARRRRGNPRRRGSPAPAPVPGAVPPAGFTQQPGAPVPPNPYYGQPPQNGKSKLPLIIGIIAAVIVAGLVGFGAYKYIGGMTKTGAATGTALTQMLDQAGFNRQFSDGGTLDE